MQNVWRCLYIHSRTQRRCMLMSFQGKCEAKRDFTQHGQDHRCQEIKSHEMRFDALSDANWHHHSIVLAVTHAILGKNLKRKH